MSQWKSCFKHINGDIGLFLVSVHWNNIGLFSSHYRTVYVWHGNVKDTINCVLLYFDIHYYIEGETNGRHFAEDISKWIF